AVGIERALEIVAIEFDAKRLQIAVLLLTQRRDREAADRFDVRQIGAHFVEITLCELANVFAVIAVLREMRVLAQKLLCPRTNGKREILDLRARIVVIELAQNRVALPFEQRRDGVTERRLAPMSDMQRPGRIRRDEFHDDPLAGVRIAAPESIAEDEHAGNDRLPLGRRKTKIDEAGTRRFDGGHDI